MAFLIGKFSFSIFNLVCGQPAMKLTAEGNGFSMVKAISDKGNK